MSEIECKITGEVQGVFFRDYIKEKAIALSIVGFAENKDDGSIYIVAQGARDNLEKLIDQIRKGPPIAKIESVDVKWNTEPTQKFNDFQINY